MLKNTGIAGLAIVSLWNVAAAQSPGTLGWAVSAGGPGADYVYDATMLADGSVVITGEYWNQITFNTTFDTSGKNCSGVEADPLSKECDMFVAKYSSQGVLLWANHAGGKYSDRGLRVREVGASVEVTGTGFGCITFSGVVTLPAEEEYYFIANYDTATGAFVSASIPATLGGRTDTPLLQPSVNLGVPNWLVGLADGSSIRTGRIWLAEKLGSTTLASQGGEDALIARQDSGGAVLWAKSAGGPGKDWGNAVAARPDGVGGVVVVGNFDQAAVFGLGEPGETTLSVSGSNAESDIFLAKYRLASETTTTFESRAAEDGYIRESGDTGVGGAVFSAAADPYAISLGDDNVHRQYVGVLSFDTSSIPDSATISSVTLTLTRSAQVGDDPFVSLTPLVVDVKSGALNGNSALEIADFQAPVDAAQAATMSAGATSTGTLNLAGRNAINKTGLTQMKLRFLLDDDGDAVIDGVAYYSGENGTSANRPKLSVTWY